jgi:predicted O-linked N-acetylglucosamine transferase (SPINDLY family)
VRAAEPPAVSAAEPSLAEPPDARLPAGIYFTTEHAEKIRAEAAQPAPTRIHAAALQDARLHEQHRRWAAAEMIYRKLLAESPDDAEIIHRLGAVAFNSGRADAADILRRAAAVRPLDAEIQCNLGRVLAAAGRGDEAIVCFARATDLRPNYLEAIIHLGNAQRQAGQLQPAIESLWRAAAIGPKSAKALNSLGAALLSRPAGDIDEAVEVFNRAIAVRPDYAPAIYNLGTARMAQGRRNEAIEFFRRAIELQPEFAEAHSNLGHEYQAAGRLDEAIACYRRVLELNPAMAEGQINLGSALWSRGRLAEAQAVLSDVVRRHPEDAKARSNLGIVQLELGTIDEAIANLRHAAKLLPDSILILDNLGVALREQGQTREAVECFERVIAQAPKNSKAYYDLAVALTDVGRVDDAIPYYRQAIERNDIDAHSNFLFSMHYSSRIAATDILAEARQWAQKWEQPLRERRARHLNRRDPDKRLRVGFVSPDYRLHSVSFFLMPLVQSIDPRQIELAFYSNLRAPDAMTAQYQSLTSFWREIIGMSDEQAAEQIRRDQIDVLIDLSGHSGDNRLRVMAYKPAPVQASMIGFGGTTGMESIDYRITDAWADPPGLTDANFSERLVRISPTNWCYAPPPDTPAVRLEPYSAGNSIVTFGSINTYAKVGPAVLDVWARILHAVPRSRILFKAARLHSSEVREMVHRQMESRGIARDRLEIRGAVRSLAAHLEVYRDIDIALDPFPYAGTTTTCETIWMGVPLVTRAGDTHISRVGVSLLNNLGLPELIGRDSDDYIRIAVELAGDGRRLAELRRSMRARMSASPLMDKGAYARAVESAFRWMWRQWCESPAGPAASENCSGGDRGRLDAQNRARQPDGGETGGAEGV